MSIVRYAGKKPIRRYAAIFTKRTFVTSTAGNAGISEKNFNSVYINRCRKKSEDFAKKKEYREQFDLCVSRAVANLSTLSEYCLPFVAVNGSFVSYKSGDSEEEIQQAKHAISLLGGKVKNVDKFQLPGTDMGRALVEIKKTKQTPGKYPRKAGLPAKEPLK